MFFNSVPQLLFFQFYSWKNCCFVIYFDLFSIITVSEDFLGIWDQIGERSKKKEKIEFFF
jgi:hypothetical protein